MKKALVAGLLACVLALATAADMVTRVKIVSPLDVGKTASATGMFDDLSPDGLAAGLGEAQLYGSVKYQPAGDGKTRVTVDWHSIGVARMGSSATEPLKSPLRSQFVTDGKRIEANTGIAGSGDLDGVLSSFSNLQSKLAGKGTPRQLVTSTNNTQQVDDKRVSANDLAPGGSRTGAGNALTGAQPLNSNNNQVKTDMIGSRYEDCTPRIDLAGGMVYPQARKIEETATGRVMSVGSCGDYGNPVPIEKTYGGDCQPIYDFTQMKVFEQYKQSATLNGKALQVSLCAPDYAKATAITESTTGCGVRNDFILGVAVQQSKLIYRDATANKDVTVKECADSLTKYAHYQTEATCTPTLDQANGLVFINRRVAYKDNNGAEQYATECRPDSSGLAVKEAYCDPKYEHDFVGNVSYYRTRSYYVNTAGTPVYLSQCSRSALASFPHVKSQSGCGGRNADDELKTYWSFKTLITTPDDGTLEVAPCTESASATAYAYAGEVASSYTGPLVTGAPLGDAMSSRGGQWPAMRSLLPANIAAIADRGTNSFGYTLVGYVIEGSGIATWRAIQDLASPTLSPSGPWSLDSQLRWYANYSARAGDGPYARLKGNIYYPKYLRGDGTYYQATTPSRATLTMAACFDYPAPGAGGGFSGVTGCSAGTF